MYQGRSELSNGNIERRETSVSNNFFKGISFWESGLSHKCHARKQRPFHCIVGAPTRQNKYLAPTINMSGKDEYLQVKRINFNKAM